MERYDYLKVRVVENREVIKSEDAKIERLTPEGIKPELFKYTINGKVGLLNSEGEEITPCIYDDISYIIGDGVLIIPSLNGKEGLLNENGVLTVPCEYDSIRKDQLGNSSKYYKAVKKRGETHIIDRTGKVLASSTGDIKFITETVLLERNGDSCRIVDIENPENNKVLDFNGTVSAINIIGSLIFVLEEFIGSKGWSIFDSKGNRIAPSIVKDSHDSVSSNLNFKLISVCNLYLPTEDDTFIVNFGNTRGIVSKDKIDSIVNWFNKDGNLLVPDTYDSFEQVSDNLFSVGRNINGKMLYGLYNVKTKQEILPPTYQEIHPFSEGLAVFETRQKVRINGKLEDRNKKGYIDESGNVVIEPIYDVAEDMQNGVAKIGIINPTAKKEQYLYGLVDSSGEEYMIPAYDRLSRYPEYVEVSSGVKDPKVKLIGYEGNMLTPLVDGEHILPLEGEEYLAFSPSPFTFTSDFWEGYRFATNDNDKKIGPYTYIKHPSLGNFHVIYFAVRDIDGMPELLYGVLDDNHNVAICPQYSSLISLDNGYFLAGITYRKKVGELYDLGSEVTKWGVIDKTGAVIADFVYELGDDGRILVKNGRKYFVDDKGNLCEPYRKIWAEKYIKSCEPLQADSEHEILEYMSVLELSDGRTFIVSDADFEIYRERVQGAYMSLIKIESSDRYKEYLASLQSLEQQMQSLIKNEISKEFTLEMKPKKS